MNLKNLTSETLLNNTKNLVARERELLLEVLNHLKEIDCRKLFLELGYPSLWAYCTKDLGYTEAAAQRRIEAMRALRDMPILAEKIEEGSLSLSSVAKVQSLVRKVNRSAKTIATDKRNKAPIISDKHKFITPDQKLDLFLALENKSQKEVDKILAGHFPEEVKVAEKIRPVSEKHSEVRFVAEDQLLKKLEKVKSLLSHKNPNPTMAELLSLMADFVIAKKDPIVKKMKATLADSSAPPPPPAKVQPMKQKNRRYVAAPIRREVWQAAQGSCEFTNPHTGRRCQSRHKLEIEHLMPIAFGGTNDRENLKLYCRAHNVQAARAVTLMV